MPSTREILASLGPADRGTRYGIVVDLGTIRSRGNPPRYYLDFRPYGRVWTNRGIRITDEGTARRLLEQIRGQVAEGDSLETVLARYQPATSKANSVPTWLARWLEIRRRETAAGDMSPGYLSELERFTNPGGHFAFFDRDSIHEFSYGKFEDWSLWLADRGLSPKTRKNVLAAFQGFLAWLKRRGEIREVPEFPRIKVAEREPRIIAISDQDRVLGAIPEEDRGIFFAMAHLGIRPGEARALLVSDYHRNSIGDRAWLTVDKAFKGKTVSAPVRGTKTGRSKRLPVGTELEEWIERHVDAAGRLHRHLLFVNPRTSQPWAHKALQRIWNEAVEAAELPPISLYEGTKHSFATDAIRRGVPERHLQRFLGHKNVQSTRRYARLADTALIEVLRPSSDRQRQASDKHPATEPEQPRDVSGGPSRTRTWDRPVMSRLL